MESSDDSFIWTDASSNSEMAVDVKPEPDNPNKKKTKKRKLGEDIEDGPNKEKKYRQIKSEPESDIDIPKKKKKRQNESSISKDISGEIDNYLDIRVKQEQESFAETSETVSKKKKKHKKDHDFISNGLEEQHSLHEKETEDYGNSIVGNNDNVANEEIDNYFNFRVKQEQASFVEPTEIKLKKKKKSKKSLDTFDNVDLHSSESVNEKNDSELDFENSVRKNEVNIKEERDEYKKKKKKSKKKQEDHDVSETNNLYKDISEHDFDNSEYNESGIIPNSSTDAHNDMSIDEDIIDKDAQSQGDQQVTGKKKNKIVKKRESKTSQSSNSDKEQTKQNKSISERLRFEDEDMVDYTLDQDTQLANNWPKQIKNFVTLRKNITHVSIDAHNGNFVSEDDDVWIIKCPHEFDIKDFININLTLDNKCKIKLNGQTYDGVLDDSIQRVPILAMEHNKNKLLVKNVPVKGITKFRKRIPKAHIPDQGMLPTNLNNFIPLPETKCRHPLFGANYKKAIKIPSAIVERLNGHNASIEKSSLTDTCKPKKKKHKKEKCKMENDYSYETEVVVEEKQVTSSKKKRKRKHSEEVDGTQHTQHSSKRIKQDPDSADVWESEQAIENSLFGLE